MTHAHVLRALARTSKRIVAVVSMLALAALLPWPRQDANAATMTVVRDYLNRQQAGITTGIQHDIFFTTIGAVSGGAGVNEVRIIFPDADDADWCRTAGSLTVTGIANPTGGTETATTLPGTLAGTCAQGSGTGTAEANRDRLLITGVDNLSATTKYGFRVVGNVAVLGTADSTGNDIQVEVRTHNGTSQVDAGTLALSLITSDQVAVSATVTPTLTVTLSGTTAALGTLSASNVNQAGVDTTVSTNASGGYISMVKYNNTLTSGSDTVPDTSGGTIAAGTAEFGASSSDTGNTIGVWSPTACSTTATTSNATALTTAFQAYAANTVPVSSEATTLCFLASITGSQPAGNYTSTATVVTTARF